MVHTRLYIYSPDIDTFIEFESMSQKIAVMKKLILFSILVLITSTSTLAIDLAERRLGFVLPGISVSQKRRSKSSLYRG